MVQCITAEQFMPLYKQGLHDWQIARHLQVSISTVRLFRRERGLPAAPRRAATADEEVRELYEQGLNDTQIAARLGVSATTIYKARHRLGLPAQPNARDSSYAIGPEAAEHIRRLKAAGVSDLQVAEMYHVCLNTIVKYRKRHGIPGARRRHRGGGA